LVEKTGQIVKQKKIQVRILKTLYPHWGCHTAFNAFLRYFDQNVFSVTMKDVPMGGDGTFLPAALSRLLTHGLKRKKLQEYRLNDLWAEWRMLGHAFFQNIDVVHFIDAEHSMLFLPGWFRKFRFMKTFPKIVGMFHQPPAILETIIDPEIASQADHVLTVAPEQAEFFARFMPAERISTILLGVDTEHFKPLFTKKETGNFRCLAGGVWLRDYEAVFKTAKLLEDISEVEFHLVSPAIENPGSMKNVIFYKGISDTALMDLYQNSHVLCMPMKDATANTFLLEGCACGLPIVSSDLPSIKVYFPGDEAILVKDNDPHAFAGALTDLYHDPDKHSRMSYCARQRALQLSWEKIVKEYEQLYLNLCGR